MNTCDVNELKHQLLQKFYAFCRTPELWKKERHGMAWLCWISLHFSGFELRRVDDERFSLHVNGVWIESGKQRWLRKDTTFFTAARKLWDDHDIMSTCRKLEAALK